MIGVESATPLADSRSSADRPGSRQALQPEGMAAQTGPCISIAHQ